MLHEKSCGAIVYRKRHGNTEILLIKHVRSGCWSFPKGHMEADESEYATALREVMEETASRIAILSDFRETVNYSPAPGVMKEVVYFLAFTTEPDIRPREGEIAEVEWVPIEKAESLLPHETEKTVFRRTRSSLSHLSISIK